MDTNALSRPLFVAYAETCFATFGDRVKNWATFNEPHLFAYKYNNYGCVVGNCKLGMNNISWPYMTMHHMLLSHAATFQVYKSKFQVSLRLFFLMNLAIHMLQMNNAIGL